MRARRGRRGSSFFLIPELFRGVGIVKLLFTILILAILLALLTSLRDQREAEEKKKWFEKLAEKKKQFIENRIRNIVVSKLKLSEEDLTQKPYEIVFRAFGDLMVKRKRGVFQYVFGTYKIGKKEDWYLCRFEPDEEGKRLGLEAFGFRLKREEVESLPSIQEEG